MGSAVARNSGSRSNTRRTFRYGHGGVCPAFPFNCAHLACTAERRKDPKKRPPREAFGPPQPLADLTGKRAPPSNDNVVRDARLPTSEPDCAPTRAIVRRHSVRFGRRPYPLTDPSPSKGPSGHERFETPSISPGNRTFRANVCPFSRDVRNVRAPDIIFVDE